MFACQMPVLGYPEHMPLYEYRCNDCTSVFEVMRPMAQRELAAVCPACESRASMPLISRVGMLVGGEAGALDRPGPAAEGGCCGGACGCGAG
ncbi:MAG: FmdB family zinc ribbon protein [Candidatus Dormibacteria bacterium]